VHLIPWDDDIVIRVNANFGKGRPADAPVVRNYQ
jgi:hypothetical protein